MTTRTFAINTQPHEAIIGNEALYFEPEVIGAEFAEAYAELRAMQTKVNGVKANSTKHGKAPDVSAQTLTELSQAMRTFIARFLLPDSRTTFAAMRLPDRVLVELLEYAAELYGSGPGNDRGGQSSDSA